MEKTIKNRGQCSGDEIKSERTGHELMLALGFKYDKKRSMYIAIEPITCGKAIAKPIHRKKYRRNK